MPTKTKTPAEIPAETTAAHRAEFNPTLPLTAIRQHPDNPRHDAVADHELIDSVSEQGLIHALVLAPHPDEHGMYVLIDGHRRYDALTKAGFTFAKVEIRHDLTERGDQVAAMLATVRRRDLTPVEEAEGFDLLSDLGWTVDAIAAKTGRAKSTVSERRKLTRLPEKAKQAADTGQITIDDAIRMAKLPAAEQKKLDKQVGGYDFKYAVARAEQRVRTAAVHAAEVKRLKDAGVPELDRPQDAHGEHALNHASHGMVRLAATGLPDASSHHDTAPPCLAFVQAGTTDYPAIWQVCTNPAKHDDDLSEAQATRQAEVAAEEAVREADREARAEEARAHRTARMLRIDSAVAAVKTTKALDPTLEALLRLALPRMFYALYDSTGVLVEVLGIDTPTAGTSASIPCEWISAVHALTAPQLVKAFAAFLAHETDDLFEDLARGFEDQGTPSHEHIVAGWPNLLTSVGHELNSVDRDLLDKASSVDDEED